MIIPLYSYTKDYRHSQFIDFLVRCRGIGKNDKFTKSQFIEKCWLQNRTARDLWKKGIFINDYFRGIDGDTVYLRTKQTVVVCEVAKNLWGKIKSLPDFKLFITAIQAGKRNDYSNRSRTRATIARQTGTQYVATVSKRTKRARKLWLISKQRFIQRWAETMQIANSYSLPWVTFLFNKFRTPDLILNSHIYAKVARANKEKATCLELVKKWVMVCKEVYLDYDYAWNKITLI